MIRQYYAQRSRGGDNPLRVGIIPTGAIFYFQDEGWWRDRFRGALICRNPWIVEGFLNGVLCAARRNRDAGRWEDVAIRTLIHHEDEGLRRDPATYPDLPKVRVTRPISSPVIRPAKPRRRPAVPGSMPGTSQQQLASL
jgi:hypothetical protein